jgi:hypothetical protein
MAPKYRYSPTLVRSERLYGDKLLPASNAVRASAAITSSGGDIAKFEGDNRGIVFFMDGDKACTPMLARSGLLSMMDDVAADTIKRDGADL